MRPSADLLLAGVRLLDSLLEKEKLSEDCLKVDRVGESEGIIDTLLFPMGDMGLCLADR